MYCIVKFPSLGLVLWLCPSLHQVKNSKVRSTGRRVTEKEMKFKKRGCCQR